MAAVSMQFGTFLEDVNRRDCRTLVADSRAEVRIASDLQRIGKAVSVALEGRLRALLLVGGYARGEGSVVMRNGNLSPYNDYDFMAVVKHGPSLRGELKDLSQTWTRNLGVDVDIAALSEKALESMPRTLFWLDVSLGGFEVVAGDSGVDAALRKLSPRDIPLEECGRLLANRAVGLALSNLESTDTDYRKARHAHKSVLACGDALLLAADSYRPTLAQRLAMLERLEDAPYVGHWLVNAYRDAVEFRIRPDLWRPARGDLDRWYQDLRKEVCGHHLRFELWRIGAPVTPAEFASWRGRLYPELPDVRPGGAIWSWLNMVLKREAGILPYLGHIRERLARVAVALAYDHRDSRSRRCAARLMSLRKPDTGDAEFVHALARLAAEGG